MRGWVKLRSFTDPPENLVEYRSWLLEQGNRQWEVQVESVRASGHQLLAKLPGVDDRDVAQALAGTTISVPRSALPACARGEYYWTDLEGLEVRTQSGESLGRVSRLLATGANDVLVLDGPGERMIPFIPGRVVAGVDLEAGCIIVDWDWSYWE